MNPALMAMLPPNVRAALEGGAAPEDLVQSLMAARMQAAESPRPEEVIEGEESWPMVGWGARPRYEVPLPEPQAPVDPPPVILDRVIDVARAIGACPVCLGDAPACPVCAGEGHPGWMTPEPQLFLALIVPALERLQSDALTQAGRAAQRFAGRPPDPPTGNGQQHTNGHPHTN